MKLLRLLLLSTLVLSLPSLVEAKGNEKASSSIENNSEYSGKNGIIRFSIYSPTGVKLSDAYGVAVYRSLQKKSKKGKKVIVSSANQANYELKLKSGRYDFAIMHEIEDGSNTLLTWYKNVQILPKTILHKKLYIDHKFKEDIFE